MHPSLDPFDVGKRESRDSDEHPQSLAIAVLFDVTGSMGSVPRTLQKKLPKLLGLLKDGGYAADPQLMFGAIGDATCDRAPLQVGQFESDNRMDGDLERILLEGGGGGQKTESYELAMYFMARHTATDCFEKRGKRGYLFIIGDEMPYPAVKPREVERLDRRRAAAAGRRSATSSRSSPGAGTPTTSCPRAPPTPATARCSAPGARLLGQNVIELADLDAVCETIALTVGLGEETIDLDEGLATCADVGSAAGPTVRRALAAIGAYRGRHRAAKRRRRRALRAGARPRGGPARRTRPERLRPGLSRGQRAAVNGHVIVVDLGYGDAGKGTIVDWLCAQAHAQRDAQGRPVQAVVRFNGGAQAGAPRARARTATPHAFAQFGSGTLHAGDPDVPVQVHARRPASPWSRRRSTSPASVSPTRSAWSRSTADALLTTPYHRAANQAREEARGDGQARLVRHGHRRDGRATRSTTRTTRPASATSRAPRTLIAQARQRCATGSPTTSRPSKRTVPMPLPPRRAPGGRLPRHRRPGDAGRRRLPDAAARAGPGRLRGRPGRAARRMARLPPVHDLVDDDVRERGDAAARERARRATRLGVTRDLPDPARPRPVPDRGPDAATCRSRTTRTAAGRARSASATWTRSRSRYAAEVTGGVDAVALTHLDTARRARGRAPHLPRLPPRRPRRRPDRAGPAP